MHLMKRCKKLGGRSLRSLMDLSVPLAELNRQRFQDMSLPFTLDNAKPCLLAFQGDVYKSLDAATLSRREMDYAQDHLRILSGLYGLLRPLDLIQPYRLEMGTRLSNARGKNLYQFWGNRLVDSLNAEDSERSFGAVLNLASKEYFKAVQARALNAEIITPVFKDLKNVRVCGERLAISHYDPSRPRPKGKSKPKSRPGKKVKARKK